MKRIESIFFWAMAQIVIQRNILGGMLMSKEVARDAFNLAMQIFKHVDLQKLPSRYNIKAHPPKHATKGENKKKQKFIKNICRP